MAVVWFLLAAWGLLIAAAVLMAIGDALLRHWRVVAVVAVAPVLLGVAMWSIGGHP